MSKTGFCGGNLVKPAMYLFMILDYSKMDIKTSSQTDFKCIYLINAFNMYVYVYYLTTTTKWKWLAVSVYVQHPCYNRQIV